MLPLVSIIIPCYNDGKYLCEAVASAQTQTYTSCEIIIANDHSDDPRTLKVLRELSAESIPVITTPDGKKGPSAARNAGIAHAKGAYILPLDADDIIEPTYVEKAVMCMMNDQKLGICYCKARFFGLKRGPWTLPSYSWATMLCGNVIFSTALYRKADWEQVGGYDESLLAGLEDYAFWLHILAIGRDVFCLEDELFHYRIKANSRTATMLRCNDFSAFDAMYLSCENIFKENTKILLTEIQRLQHERDMAQCLFSWKIFSVLGRLEWAMRQCIKRMLGRA